MFAAALRLSNGKSAAGIVAPIYSRGNFLGFVIAVFDEGKAAEDVLSEYVGQGYAIAVLEDDHEVYRLGSSSPKGEGWAQEVRLDVPVATWRVRVWPEPELLRGIVSKLPVVAIIAGSLIGFSALRCQDFVRTARHIARELRDSKERLLEIIASAMDAIISVDESQRIAVFNHAAERIFRCSSSEAVGQAIDKFIPERFREAHREHIRNFGRTGVSTRTMTSPRLWGVRTEFPLEASISQTKTGGEKLYTVILRDVSFRRQAEEELRRACDDLGLRVKERTAELQSTNEKRVRDIIGGTKLFSFFVA